ncbi:hypothetical protein ACS0TY_035913 [Phlomoides rotata]
MDMDQVDIQFLGLHDICKDAAFFALVLAFSLLSTAAVVYTTARFYTSGQTTSFRDVVRVVLRVWKRLIVTFLCAFLAFCPYNAFFAAFLYVWSRTIADSTAGDVVLVIVLLVYPFGFVYLTIVWQLGSVISVLEDSYGIKAMIKSVGLIRGSWGISIVVYLVPILFYATLISVSMVNCVIFRDSMGVIGVLGFGGLILVLSVKMILLGLMMQTVLYFACKSCLHESVDKSALRDWLKGYLVDYYVPLKAKDVQMEEYEHHVSENSI